MQNCVIIMEGEKYPFIFNNKVNLWELWEGHKIIMAYNDNSETIYCDGWHDLNRATTLLHIIQQMKRKQKTNINNN